MLDATLPGVPVLEVIVSCEITGKGEEEEEDECGCGDRCNVRSAVDAHSPEFMTYIII